MNEEIKKSKNQLAAEKRWSNPEYKQKVSQSVKKTLNSKEFLEKKLKIIQGKLKNF